ncbi:TPR and ankyrin repeat-containing protein 1 isoform X2 [Callorhinchus milii]|uniref:TPR and ankyrin repeat-containing protein 1 isoform X2 n=1 Tax=Callorhinchus milii TaxID=7868 RepID=UPI0004571DFE|nr:TPR and ankyrin repeat-containing protein 1 isoform X2 [Callorhinchus milii]|eukprot:gi/632971581/ref/XP_007902241.1/ PREDICTED: TPR and ankyrin repeat-containing protein 1 isoform X2 [Callorhinchus milii]
MDPLQFADHLKEEGNEAFKQHHYTVAIQKYDQAIKILHHFFNHGSELAVLFCNKSNALCKLQRWQDAFHCANYAISMDPMYIKGYYWAGIAIFRLGNEQSAWEFICQGLNILDYDREQYWNDITDFIVGFLTVAESGSPVVRIYMNHVLSKRYRSHIWQVALEKAAKKNLWKAIYFVLCELKYIPENYSAASISLKELFEWYPSLRPISRITLVTKLFRMLVIHEANLDSIGPYPLHAILRLALKAYDRKLLKFIITQRPQLRQNINQTDENGASLLNVVASYPISSGYEYACQTEDVRFLLQLGVDPQIPDKLTKLPTDYLKKCKNFKAIDVINKHSETISATASESAEGMNQMEANSRGCAAVTFEEATACFVQFCRSATKKACRNLLSQREVQMFLQQLSTFTEINPVTVCEIDSNVASTMIKQLLDNHKWHEAWLLLLGGGNGKSRGQGGLVVKCDFSDVDLSTVIVNLDKYENRKNLLQNLIDRGALPRDGSRPIRLSLEKEDFEVVHLLVANGADPHDISLTPGDSPLHAAIYIALEHKDEFGLHILKFLLKTYSSDPSAFRYLDPNCQDVEGNTVLHKIFQKPSSRYNEEIMDLLAKYDIKIKMKNKRGKEFTYGIKKQDPRLLMWNKVRSRNRKKREQTDQSQKSHSSKLAQNVQSRKQSSQQKTMACDKASNVGLEHLNCTLPSKLENEANKILTREEVLMCEIAKLIQHVNAIETPTEVSFSKPLLPHATIENGRTNKNVETVVMNSTADYFNCDTVLGAQQNEGEPDVTDLQDLDLDNMTWEIECTAGLLKKLRSRDVPQRMKERTINVIQQLGNGEWTQSLQKPLKHLKSPIKLFEAKLNKGGRMLWELAVDFSPRCSEKPEKIFETELSSHHAERTTGRVYSEIIRIWDIVLDHNKLNHALDMVHSAYNRGSSCILRKKLKVINEVPLSSSLSVQKRIPLFFVEYVDWEEMKENLLPEYFPPASAVETEYNIMKFHSFSTNMALNIITDIESKAEYPFRVGELEYAIIDLVPKPLETIILIGRSGTGKTTCCLYRLWKKFQTYWEKAQEVGGPWLVRQLGYRRKPKKEEEVDDEKDTATADDGAEPLDDGDKDINCEDESCNAECNGMALSCLDNHELITSQSDAPMNPDGTDKLENLHQVFVTKNHVLCQEVLRNFVELTKSTKATGHFKAPDATVHRLQDIKDENFPLFITSKQLILLLDASLPDPFFPRNEDGSLKRSIVGWSVCEDTMVPDLVDEDEEDDHEDDFPDDEHKAAEGHSKEHDSRIFVTYEVFAHDLWPKMMKGKPQYNPALVWKEIRSFLKGSIEALTSPRGYLTLEQYINLGKKRAPNFQEDRSEIHRLFLMYQQIKSQRGCFDEEDLLRSLSLRLSKLDELPWSIHELYGDEIQDFTQAELALLMKCINDPNSMFLTGDTAQSIMKGVAFRFSDLRSLFYYASIKQQSNVRVPKRIYQLHQNYRSHSGILNLASGVVDLLQYYFPESFDRLPKDTGLFDGPQPSLLDSCSVSDLAILLRGNKRKSQPIEFGAHQVILVANEKAKEMIPEELNLALVLTIYEAKGLEFDDVLLYNFFTDSEADKEWRIISSFQPSPQSTDQHAQLLEQPIEDIVSQTRPLEFNAELHKLLNGELKQLYTAFTRARVNLWIFDENKGKRGPAFEYFIKRGFVKVVKPDENKELDDSMFVKTSTNEEWVERGDYFAKHQCWKVAAKCYQKGGEIEKEKLALAHDAVLNVQTKKRSQKAIQMEYLALAKTYLECNVPKLSLKCLRNAKEYKLCGDLSEKLGKMKDAATMYRKAQCYKQSAKCYEQVDEFELALKMLCCGELYNDAAQAIKRYETILCKKKYPFTKLPYTADQFWLEAAAKYLREHKPMEMMNSLSCLHPEDQLVFLKAKNCVQQAAELLKEQGREEEAAVLMREHGKLQEAARLSNKKEFQAECLVAAARVSLLRGEGKDISGSDKLEILEEAINLLGNTEHLVSGLAEALLLKAVITKNTDDILAALNQFRSENNSAGMVETLFVFLQHDRKRAMNFQPSLNCLEVLLQLVKAFDKPHNNAEKEMVKASYAFWGILHVDAQYGRIPIFEGARILQLISDPDLKEKMEKEGNFYKCEVKELRKLLQKHLLLRFCHFAEEIKKAGLSVPDVCPKFVCGLECTSSSCHDHHHFLLRHEAQKSFAAKFYLTALNGMLVEAKHFFTEKMFPDVKKIEDILTGDQYALCKPLLCAVFPKHFHQRIVSENAAACKIVLGLVNSIKYNSFKTVLRMYIASRFESSTARDRRESTDLWLEAQQVYLLTSDYPNKIEFLLEKEESAYRFERAKQSTEKHEDKKVQSKRRKDRGPEGKFGMLNTKTLPLCFFRLLVTSMNEFYKGRDPEKCIHTFFRFMNVPVMKCVEPLIPSIVNTVMMLEFQFVLCCSVLMRLVKNLTFCLPRSFIALFYYWDFMFNGKNAFSIINEYKPKDSQGAVYKMRRHLFYLVKVLCGWFENFNVLLDAFSNVENTLSGEAERTVVLCLVMLVNIELIADPQIEQMIRYNFNEAEKHLNEIVAEHKSKVPVRLIKVVEKVNAARSLKMVVDALEELLNERDGEYLHDCEWRWEHLGPGSVRGIYFQKLKADRFSNEFQTEIHEIVFEPKENKTAPEVEQHLEESDDHLQDIASTVQKKNIVKQRWRRLLHVILFCKYLLAASKQGTSVANKQSEAIPSNFREAQIDSTQCDLCGVKFSSSFKSYINIHDQDYEEATNQTELVTDNWEEMGSQAVELTESFLTHISHEDHRAKKAAYDEYLKWFIQCVEPILREGQNILQSFEETAIDYLASKEQSRVIYEKLKNNIDATSTAINAIYVHKKWAAGRRAGGNQERRRWGKPSELFWREAGQHCYKKF